MEIKTSLSNEVDITSLSLKCSQSNMVHRMSHKRSTYYFVEQKVRPMTQLKTNILKGNNESPQFTTEVKKLPFIQ